MFSPFPSFSLSLLPSLPIVAHGNCAELCDMIYFRNARTENALQDWPRRQEDATQNELPRYVLLTLSLSISPFPSLSLTLTYTHNFRQHKTSTSCAAFAHLIITCRRATRRGHDIESLRTLLAIDLVMAKKGNNIGYPSLLPLPPYLSPSSMVLLKARCDLCWGI